MDRPPVDLAPTHVARADRRGWVIGIALAVSAATTLLLCGLFHAVFMVNDDPAMSAFASGAYTGRPSAHMVFIGWVPGQLLAALYRAAPRIAWYGLLLLTAQVVCLAAIGALCWTRRRALGRLHGAMLVVVIAAYLPVFTLTPTFTVTATIIAATALYLLAFSFDASRRASLVLRTGAAVCVASAATLRWETVLGVAVVLMPFVVALLWRVRWRQALIVFGLAGVLFGTAYVADTVWAHEGAWGEYASYNTVRAKLHGTEQLAAATAAPGDPAMQAMFADNGWDLDDLTLFNWWFFDDPVVYSKAHLQRLLDVTGDAGYHAPIRTAVSNVLDGRRGLFALAGLCFAVGAWRRRWRRIAVLAAQLGWSFAVFVAMAARIRLPDRVAIPSLFALSVTLLLATQLLGDRTRRVVTDARADADADADAEERTVDERVWVVARRAERPLGLVALLAAAALVVGPIATLRGPVALSDANALLEQRLTDQLRALDVVDPVGRFIALGSALTLEAVDPVDGDAGTRSTRVLQMGWATFSPSFEERKRQLGLGDDLLTDLATQDHLYLIGPDAVIPILERVYARRLGWTIASTSYAQLAEGMSIWEIRRSGSVTGGS